VSENLRTARRAFVSEESAESFARLYVARKRSGELLESLPGEIPAAFGGYEYTDDGSDYDWNEVFQYANGDKGAPRLAGNTDPSRPTFSLADVRYVIAEQVGENDGDDWCALVELHGGRFGYVTAGCDYTGWG